MMKDRLEMTVLLLSRALRCVCVSERETEGGREGGGREGGSYRVRESEQERDSESERELIPWSPQRIPMPDGVHIDHVSCGSAHTICWSSLRRKLVCNLPKRVPMEFNHLQALPMATLRNRLIVLHHFSNLFSKSLSLFSLQTRHGELVAGVGGASEGAFSSDGFDGLRGVLVSSAKVSFLFKVLQIMVHNTHINMCV